MTFPFEFHANLPHVMRLALHLEGKRSVVFRDTSDPEVILNEQKHST